MVRLTPVAPHPAPPRMVTTPGAPSAVAHREPATPVDGIDRVATGKAPGSAMVSQLLGQDPAQGLQTALDKLAATPVDAQPSVNLARLIAVFAHRLDGNWDRASAFLSLAERLDPGSERTRGLKLRFLVDTKQRAAALALADELCRAHPAVSDYRLTRLNLLLEDARPAEALAEVAALQALLASPALRGGKRRRVQLGVAKALFKGGQPDAAVAIYRELLRVNADDVAAHVGIAELVLPDFAAPNRAEVEAALRDGGAALVSGDTATAKAKAQAALALAPDDGLAHKLLVWASLAARRAAREVAAGGPRLVGPLAEPECRAAAVRGLEAIVSRARVGSPARAATPQDLFPAWTQLTPLQQATVAYSLLAFGKVLPTLVEQGLVCHLVPPGVSAVDFDPKMTRDNRNAFGRYHYAVRGWRHGDLIVIGAEKLDGIARGSYNTLTHEFAHAVHQLLKRTSDRGAPGLGGPVVSEAAAEIDALYAEAMARENDQSLLDCYSGNTVWEYLAQGWMAYLAVDVTPGENTAARLFSRNPHLFQCVRALTVALADYPPLVPAPNPPAVGEHEQLGAAELLRLAGEGETSELRACAGRCFEALAAFYRAAPATFTDAHRARESELLAQAKAAVAAAGG